MATSKKFSQLPAASSITNNDLAAIAHEDALAETGYESQKATMIQIGKKLLGDIEYVTDLSGFPSDEQNPFAALLYLRDSILNLLPVDEVSGAVANFETEFALPLIDVKAEIKAVETGTGAKSPSNPYVISGFTGMNLYQRGGNLFNISTKTDGKALKWADGDTFNDVKSIVSDYIEVKEGVRFTSNYYVQWCCYDKDKNYLGNILQGGLITTSGSDSMANTIPSGYGVYYLRLGYRSSQNNNEDMTEKTDIVLSVGNTALPFEPYNGTIFPVSWQTEAGEVFGGYYDFTTGKLVATMAKETVVANSIGMSVDVFTYNVSGMKSGNAMSGNCNRFNVVSSSGSFGVRLGANNATAYFYKLKDNITEITDLASCKQWFTDNPVDIVYPLATPVEYDLTPQQILPLLGVDNIWNDTNGDTTVKYKLGIQKYIDKKIAEVQALVL